MFDLTATRNVAEITMHGETHELYYRTPTTEEMVGFQAEGLARKGKKIVNRLVAARIKYGARVLTGFKIGTLGCDGKPISSDPKDKAHYRADWKELIGKAAPQLIAAVGQVAFESVRVGGAEEDLEFVSEGFAEDAPAEAPSDVPAHGKKKSVAEEGDEVPLSEG
jgi:hypothetical protein